MTQGSLTSASEGWRLDKEPSRVANPDYDAVPYLKSKEVWENYYDPDLYELEAMLRSFIQYNIDEGQWANTGKKYTNMRRFTMPMMFKLLYGRDFTKKDMGLGFKLARVMRHYSGRIQKEGSIRGMKTHSTIYNLSVARYRRVMPYSIRLRIEWLMEQGRTPNMHNMYEYADDLQAGHARNPRTEVNMALRREAGRAAYNAYAKDWKNGQTEEN